MGVGIDIGVFEKCVTRDEGPKVLVEKDVAVARRLGLLVTPSFVVGQLTEDDVVEVVTIIAGVQPIEVFRKAITEALSREERR
jgi:predicted DsbA family dithiol-disulfide isomerase